MNTTNKSYLFKYFAFYIVQFVAFIPQIVWSHTTSIEETSTLIEQYCEKLQSQKNISPDLLQKCNEIKTIEPEEGLILGAKLNIFGSPVHENLTKQSLLLSKTTRHVGINQDALIRGVYWNDDPQVLLWDKDDNGNELTWLGLDWLFEFRDVKKKSLNGKFFNSGSSILGRSHFGDMQFLHAMANKDEENSKKTKRLMMLWSEFAYKVAISEIPISTLLSDVENELVQSLFLDDETLREQTVRFLFCQGLCIEENSKLKPEKFVREIALGSILHMMQDSFFGGHVSRMTHDTEKNIEKFYKGNILEFHSYLNQDGSLHKQSDKWPESIPEEFTTDTNYSGSDPVTYGTEILNHYVGINGKHGTWNDLEGFLDNTLYKLNEVTSESGPGYCYQKDPDKENCDENNVHVTEKSLVYSTINFEEGLISKNIVKFYEYLLDKNELKTKRLNIGNSLLEQALIENNIIPRGYSTHEMMLLICRLNSNKCSNNKLKKYQKGEVFTVPDIEFSEYKYTTSRLLKKTMDKKDLKKQVDYIIEKMPSSRKYSFTLYRQIKNPEVTNQRRIYINVPLIGYKTTIALPEEKNAKSLEEIKRISPSNIFVNQKLKFKDNSIPISDGQKECDSSESYYKNKLNKMVSLNPAFKNGQNQTVVGIFEKEINIEHMDFCSINGHEGAFSACKLQKSICNTRNFNRNSKSDHGTHISGIIGARENGYGIVGVSPTSKLNFYTNNENDLRTAIDSAIVLDKISVANMSFEYYHSHHTSLPERSDNPTKRMIKANKTLFVAASGAYDSPYLQDELTRHGRCAVLPVCVSYFDNIISVASLNKSMNDLIPGTRWGKNIVDLAAPGEDVISTVDDTNYALSSGSSQSTAFVSGAAALFKSVYPNTYPNEIKERLIYTSDLDIFSIENKVLGGKLNVDRAILNADKTFLKFASSAQGDYVELKKRRDARMTVKLKSSNPSEKGENIKYKDIRRIWWDKDSNDWTIIYSESPSKGQQRVIKKLSHVYFIEPDSSHNENFNIWSYKNQGTNFMPFDLSQIEDLVVKTPEYDD